MRRVLVSLIALALACGLVACSTPPASSGVPVSAPVENAVQPAPPVEPAPTVQKQPPAPAPEVEAPAAEPVPQPGVTVYVTKTGEKYHVGSCRYLKQSKIAISLTDAKASGYGACSVCRPPE